MDNLPHTEDGYIYLGDGETISEELFISRFGDDVTYTTLINHVNATSRWKEIFKRWYSEGLI